MSSHCWELLWSKSPASLGGRRSISWVSLWERKQVDEDPHLRAPPGAHFLLPSQEGGSNGHWPIPRGARAAPQCSCHRNQVPPKWQ